MGRRSLILAFGVLVAAAVASPGADEPPRFKATPGKADDAVTESNEKGVSVLSVKCPSGIGSAVVERTAEKWPDTLVVRLHLRGLEGFQANCGDLKLSGGMSVQLGKLRLHAAKGDQPETLLDEKSPLWPQPRVIGADGKPVDGVLLKDGYFELTFPKAFFEGNPKSIRLSWVDFYRR